MQKKMKQMRKIISGAFIPGHEVLVYNLFEVSSEILPLCDFVTYIISLASFFIVLTSTVGYGLQGELHMQILLWSILLRHKVFCGSRSKGLCQRILMQLRN